MNVLVNGTGNIGTTLLALLTKYKSNLELENIYALKHHFQPWQEAELNQMRALGIILVSPNSHGPFESIEKIQNTINYIFECGPNGSGIQNKKTYSSFKNLIGASAQGSEKEFGISYMSNINNEQIKNQKFVHVVSCNTHGSASILKTFCGNNLENLAHADFVVVRRSEDLSSHQRLVSANVLSRHLDSAVGTHHAIDVKDLFATKNCICSISSSDITTPSQLMHSVRFNILLKNNLSIEELNDRIKNENYISKTQKFDSNLIFENGRRNGFQGRIYSHAIINVNNLLIDNNSIKGWAFVPQEGNSILSTLHAFLLQTNNKNENSVIKKIESELLQKEW